MEPDYKVIEHKTIDIALIGPTGHGKSTIKDILNNNPIAQRANVNNDTTRIVTTEVQLQDNIGGNIHFNITDTIGLGDDIRTTEEIISSIETTLDNHKISLIVLVFKYNSRMIRVFDEGISLMVNEFKNTHNYTKDNFLLIITGCEGLEEKSVLDYRSSLVQRITALEDMDWIWVSFPNELNYKGEFARLMHSEKNESRSRLITKFKVANRQPRIISMKNVPIHRKITIWSKHHKLLVFGIQGLVFAILLVVLLSMIERIIPGTVNNLTKIITESKPPGTPWWWSITAPFLRSE
jgi:hypothetical protein